MTHWRSNALKYCSGLRLKGNTEQRYSVSFVRTHSTQSGASKVLSSNTLIIWLSDFLHRELLGISESGRLLL